MDKTDKIIYYLISIAFFGFGILSFYRASLSDNDLIKFQGKLKNAEVVELISYKSNGGKRHIYPIVLDFVGRNERHGFYYSNKEKASNTLKSLNLEIGEDYSILYDPTVIKSIGSNVNLGIRKIKYGELTMLEETNFGNLVLGSFMVFFALALLLVLFFGDKIKQRFANKS